MSYDLRVTNHFGYTLSISSDFYDIDIRLCTLYIVEPSHPHVDRSEHRGEVPPPHVAHRARAAAAARSLVSIRSVHASLAPLSLQGASVPGALNSPCNTRVSSAADEKRCSHTAGSAEATSERGRAPEAGFRIPK